MLRSIFIQQIFVYGDSSQSVLMAIVVPEFSVIRKHLKDENLTDEEICSREDVKQLILNDIVALSEKEQVSIYVLILI